MVIVRSGKLFAVVCAAFLVCGAVKSVAAEAAKGPVDAFKQFVKAALVDLDAEKAAAFGADEKVQKELLHELGAFKQGYQQLVKRAEAKDPRAVETLKKYKARIGKLQVIDMVMQGENTVLTVTFDGKNKSKVVMKQVKKAWKIVSLD